MSEKPNTIYFQSKGFPEFRFLSNFYMSEFLDPEGNSWRSVEHYYQAWKSLDPNVRALIAGAPDCRTAKKLGNDKRVLELTEDWPIRKDVVMLDAVRMKFGQSPELTEMLLATDGFDLVEYAPWGDTYWGVDKNYEGQNKLGKILMRVRQELKESKK